LEDKYPEFKTIDSPTVRVGGKILDKFSKVLHKEKMKSLNDVKTKEEVQD
jgi:DNA ligase (NAD+)